MLNYSSRFKKSSSNPNLRLAEDGLAPRQQPPPASNHRLADIDQQSPAPIQRMLSVTVSDERKDDEARPAPSASTNVDPSCSWYAYDGISTYTPRKWSFVPGWTECPERNPGDPGKRVYMGPIAARAYQARQAVKMEVSNRAAQLIEEHGAPLLQAIEVVRDTQELTGERVQAMVRTVEERRKALKAAAEKAVSEYLTFPKLMTAIGVGAGILLGAQFLALPSIPWWLSLAITGLSTAYGVYLVWRWTHTDIPIQFSAPLATANAGVMAYGLANWAFEFIQTIRAFGIGSAVFHAHPAFIALPFALALEHVLLTVYERYKKLAASYEEAPAQQERTPARSQVSTESRVGGPTATPRTGATHSTPLLIHE